MAEAQSPAPAAVTSSSLDSLLPTRIAELHPELPDRDARVIDGVVTITWPHSILTRSIAFILAEHDPLLRQPRGQLRLEFHDPLGQRLSDACIGAGDSLRIALQDATWEPHQSKARLPNASLEWQLKFTNKLLMRVQRAEGKGTEIISLQLSDEATQDDAHRSTLTPQSSSPLLDSHILFTSEAVSTPGRHSPNLSRHNKRSASSTFDMDEFASPAFLKRARVSYGSLFEDGFDIFGQDVAKKQKQKTKPSRFSIGATGWRYGSRSPSPEPGAPEAHEPEIDGATDEENSDGNGKIDGVTSAPTMSPTMEKVFQTQQVSSTSQNTQPARTSNSPPPISPTPVNATSSVKQSNGQARPSVFGLGIAREEETWTLEHLSAAPPKTADTSSVTATTSLQSGTFRYSFGSSAFSMEHTSTASSSSIPVFDGSLAESNRNRFQSNHDLEQKSVQSKSAADASAADVDMDTDEDEKKKTLPFPGADFPQQETWNNLFAVEPPGQTDLRLQPTMNHDDRNNLFAVEPPGQTDSGNQPTLNHDDIYGTNIYPAIQAIDTEPQPQRPITWDPDLAEDMEIYQPVPVSPRGAVHVVEGEKEDGRNHEIEAWEPARKFANAINFEQQREYEDEVSEEEQDDGGEGVYDESELGDDEHYEEDDEEYYRDDDEDKYGEDQEDEDDVDDEDEEDEEEDYDEEYDESTPQIQPASLAPVVIDLLSDTEDEACAPVQARTKLPAEPVQPEHGERKDAEVERAEEKPFTHVVEEILEDKIEESLVENGERDSSGALVDRHSDMTQKKYVDRELSTAETDISSKAVEGEAQGATVEKQDDTVETAAQPANESQDEVELDEETKEDDKVAKSKSPTVQQDESVESVTQPANESQAGMRLDEKTKEDGKIAKSKSPTVQQDESVENVTQPAAESQAEMELDERTEGSIAKSESQSAEQEEKAIVDAMEIDDDDNKVDLNPMVDSQYLSDDNSVAPSAKGNETQNNDSVRQDAGSEAAKAISTAPETETKVDGSGVNSLEDAETGEDEIKSQIDADIDMEDSGDATVAAGEAKETIMKETVVEQDENLDVVAEQPVETVEGLSGESLQVMATTKSKQKLPRATEDAAPSDTSPTKDEASFANAAKHLEDEARTAVQSRANKKRQLPAPIDTRLPQMEAVDIQIVQQSPLLQQQNYINSDDGDNELAASQQIMDELRQHASTAQKPRRPSVTPTDLVKEHRRKQSDTISETSRRTRSQTKQHQGREGEVAKTVEGEVEVVVSRSSPRAHRRGSRSMDKPDQVSPTSAVSVGAASASSKYEDGSPMPQRLIRVTRSRGGAAADKSPTDPSVALATASDEAVKWSVSPRLSEHMSSRPILMRITRSMENIAEAGLKEGLVMPEAFVRSVRLDDGGSPSSTRSPSVTPLTPGTAVQQQQQQQQHQQGQQRKQKQNSRASPASTGQSVQSPSSIAATEPDGTTTTTTTASGTRASELKLQLQRELRTTLPCNIGLKSLRTSLQKTADVIAVAVATPAAPFRPKNGPRDYMLEVLLTDATSAPRGVHVAHIFRPHQQSLPVIQAGDVVLLRAIKVVSVKDRGFGLRAGDASAWAVFDEQARRAAKEAAAAAGGGGDDGDGATAVLPQIRGPPLEVGEAEARYAMSLSRWWWEVLDEETRTRVERVAQKMLAF